MLDVSSLVGVDLVITEKCDGSNLTYTREQVFARSHGKPPVHPSFDLAKATHAQLRGHLDEGLSVFCEYCYAVHSIEYEALPGYSMVFGVRDDAKKVWWSWVMVELQAQLLGLPTVPVLFRGQVSSERALRTLTDDLAREPSLLGGPRENGEGSRRQGASLAHRRQAGARGAGRGASAGPPSRPPCIPPPRPPAGARRMLVGTRRRIEDLHPAPCPSPAGTGPAGLGTVGKFCALGGWGCERSPCSPRAEARGRSSGSAPKPRTRRGSFEFSPFHPWKRRHPWLGYRLASPGLASDSLTPGSPRGSFICRDNSEQDSHPSAPSPAGPVPAGDGQGAEQRSRVYEPSRLHASCTSGGPGWGNARGAGWGAGTGPPAPAPLAAGARGRREPSPFTDTGIGTTRRSARAA
jgi:hypothetical protein